MLVKNALEVVVPNRVEVFGKIVFEDKKAGTAPNVTHQVLDHVVGVAVSSIGICV